MKIFQPANDPSGGSEITGSGTSGQVAFFNGTQTITSDSGFLYASGAGTLTTSLTSPKIIGSTAVGGNLSLQSTSGVGTTDYINFLVGNNGATEAMRISDSGMVGIGSTSSVAISSTLQVNSASGGVNTGIRMNLVANSGTAATSYIPLDFYVPTTGLVGQFLATATNYNGSNALTANSVALLAYGSSADLTLASAGGSGTITFVTGGVATGNKRASFSSSGALSLTPATQASGVAALTQTYTMPAVISGNTYGNTYNITSAGSSAQVNVGFSINYLAGYTGSSVTGGLAITNNVASTGNNLGLSGGTNSATGNMGQYTFCYGTTTGLNIGGYFSAENGAQSIGLLGKANVNKTSGSNIGVAGFANNTGTTPGAVVGGFFGLMTTTPTFATAALMADNGAISTADIFVGRDNGTAILTLQPQSKANGNQGVLLVTNNVAGSNFNLAAQFATTSTSTTSAAFGSLSNFSYRPAANQGAQVYATGTTTGLNVGGTYLAGGGNINIGAWASATVAKASTTNVGIAGFGLNTSVTSPIQVAGYFALADNGTSLPTFTSAALIADNGSTTSPVFLGKVNGTTTFTVNSTGAYYGTVDVIGTVGASATIDVTKGNLHTLTSTASTNMTLTPSAAGVAGQQMWVQITSDATGGDVITFASTFKPSGTMTLTASKVHTIQFVSDGSFWYEYCRTLAL